MRAVRTRGTRRANTARCPKHHSFQGDIHPTFPPGRKVPPLSRPPKRDRRSQREAWAEHWRRSTNAWLQRSPSTSGRNLRGRGRRRRCLRVARGARAREPPRRDPHGAHPVARPAAARFVAAQPRETVSESACQRTDAAPKVDGAIGAGLAQITHRQCGEGLRKGCGDATGASTALADASTSSKCGLHAMRRVFGDGWFADRGAARAAIGTEHPRQSEASRTAIL